MPPRPLAGPPPYPEQLPWTIGRALLIEVLVVGWGLVRFRTAVPLTARVAGWRAAGAARHPIPSEAIDRGITLREALRRLVRAR